MGLLTDSFFISALRSNKELVEQLPAGDFYNNVAYPDVDMDNVEMPYIIVNNDGGDNVIETKDDMFEGAEDDVAISIRVVARNRKELAKLVLSVRRTIRDYIIEVTGKIYAHTETKDEKLCPIDYKISFSEIAYDMLKPSHTQILNYQCKTSNEILENYEQEETG